MSSKRYLGNACAAFKAAKQRRQSWYERLAFLFGMVAVYGSVLVSHLPRLSEVWVNLALFGTFLFAAWLGVGALHWRYIAKAFMNACSKDEDIVALLHRYGGKTPDEQRRPMGTTQIFALLNILGATAVIVLALGKWTATFEASNAVHLIATILMFLLSFGLATFSARARRTEQIYGWVINGVPEKAQQKTRSSAPICLV